MPVYVNDEREVFSLPGIQHQTIGGQQQGLQSMEVWQQIIAPGEATPVHCHAYEEVIVILSGAGECTIEGRTSRFGPNSTLVIEPDAIHQITNTSTEDMKLIAVLGMAPVRVKTASGEPLPLPWDA